jgi:hypothetical protein
VDAPAAAIAWAALFARSRGVALSATNLLALGLIVWLIYLTDRLLDAWRASDSSTLKARHLFSARNRAAILSAVAVGATAAAWLVGEDLGAAEIRARFALGAVVAGYTLCVR